MKHSILFWIVAAVALAPVAAQDVPDASSDFDALAAPATDGAASDAPAAINWGTIKYSGDQEFGWRWGAWDPATRTGGFVDSKMAAEYKLGDFKAVAAARVRDNEFVPGETALFYSPGTLKFGVGYQEFSWGVADKRNPTDTLNARDYRYSVDAPRLVNPAATVAWYPASWVSVEGVYEPWKVDSKYPTDFVAKTQSGLSSQRAKLIQLITAQNAAFGAALAASYNPTASAQTTNENFDNPVVGSRANFFIPGVDLSLSYVYDRDAYYTPVVTMKQYLSGALWLPSSVELVHKRIHRLGLDAKTTVDKFGFWLETAYNITEASSSDSYDNRHNTLGWTAGMDFNYGPGSVYYVNFQYAGEYVLNYDASTSADYASALTAAQLADKAFMTRMAYRSMVQTLGIQTEQLMNTFTISSKWPLADELVTPGFDTAVIVPAGYDSTVQTRYLSAYFKPQVDWKPADGLHILVGSELTYAWVKASGSDSVSLDTTTDRLGVYTPQNNFFVKVDYNWNGSLGAK